MESAIPHHLQCPRTRHRRLADDYARPYPATLLVSKRFVIGEKENRERSTAENPPPQNAIV